MLQGAVTETVGVWFQFMKMWLNSGKVFVQENSLTELGKVLS
jgi:hypothetical protein